MSILSNEIGKKVVTPTSKSMASYLPGEVVGEGEVLYGKLPTFNVKVYNGNLKVGVYNSWTIHKNVPYSFLNSTTKDLDLKEGDKVLLGKLNNDENSLCIINGGQQTKINVSYCYTSSGGGMVDTGVGNGPSNDGGNEMNGATGTGEEYIWTYFMNSKKINNAFGVAGLMGNLVAESGLHCDRVQGDIPYSNISSDYTSRVDSGEITEEDFINRDPNDFISTDKGLGKGYGLAQWTDKVRKQGLYAMYKNGKSSGTYPSIGCIQLACDFLWSELESNTYKHVLEVLQAAKSVREASDIVLHKFEAPKDQSTSVEETRFKNGEEIYNKWKDYKPNTSETGGGNTNGSGKKIFIDPGHNHSGWDTGASGGGYKEQDLVFNMAEKLKSKLVMDGYNIQMSRNSITDNLGTDTNSSLNTRVKLSNDFGADFFISIHCNANTNSSAHGTEVYYHSNKPNDQSKASTMSSSISKSLGTYNRGGKTGNFCVIRETNCSAVLIETAFISNTTDLNVLIDADKCANAIYEAIKKVI